MFYANFLDFFDMRCYTFFMKANIEHLSGDFYFQQASNIKGSKNNEHYHDLIEIYYMKKGSCNYFIDDRSYRVNAGDIVLIPDGTIHKTNYDCVYHDRWLINCSKDFIPESVLPLIKKLPHLFANSQLTKECERIMKKIGEEYARSDEFSKDALKGLISELIFLFVRNAEYQEEKISKNLLVENVIKHLQQNYMAEVSLFLTADIFSVSPEHLSRTFKKQTGFGFSEYLTLLRLQKAEEMLKNEPGKSVNEVAFACGFNDSNYFSFKFKKAYGVSPLKVKNKKN
jgi:AraC-like DNA-binding protein